MNRRYVLTHAVVKALVRATLVTGFCVFSAEVSVAQSKDTGSRVYELRTYTTLPGRLQALNKRFADHTMRIFAKHGMKSEMYWIPTDDARKDNTLVYVLSHDSQEAADKAGRNSRLIRNGSKSAMRAKLTVKFLQRTPDRVFMKMTDYSPGK